MVSTDGAIRMLGPMHTLLEHIPLHETSACAWCNHANGGGIRFGAFFENLWEANACALIVCSFCNVF
jgi:hypothetical protein